MEARGVRARRARAAAVAIVLTAGAFASVATTSGPESCPEPTRRVVVSELYGNQVSQQDEARWTSPHELTAGGYTLSRVTVYLQACVASIGVHEDAKVRVRLDFYGGDPASPAPEDVFASFTVADGDGRVWSPSDVDVDDAQLAEDGQPARPARAGLVFMLPPGIATPVTLWLGDLDPDRLQPVSLDPPDDSAAS